MLFLIVDFKLFMKKTIKDIVIENEDLHLIKITKTNKRDRSSWVFNVIDKTSELYGVSDLLINYNYQVVTLRRGNHYFLSYKIFFGNKFEYFVDTVKANHRNSTSKYVNSLIDYFTYSNDISVFKNDSSFKFTKREMKQTNINNYLDLCAYFGDYSSIGCGYTRDVRNVVVMDIDVNCTKEQNKSALDKLLLMFAECGSLPDFYIFNHVSNHVQLQWLIQDLIYKEIDNDVKNECIDNLNMDSNKSKEIKSVVTDFIKLTKNGIEYRAYTLALTDIIPKYKFGDKNWTYWKAKNFYTAYLGLYGLELKMPLYNGHEIYYMSKEEIDYNIGTEEGRKLYFDEAPTFRELVTRTKSLVEDYIDEKKIKKVEKIKDDDDLIEPKAKKKEKKETYGYARNDFVMVCSREITWRMSRDYGFRDYKDISDLKPEEFDAFKKTVMKTVKKKFKEEDAKYKGNWPGTTNKSSYNNAEFEKTFNSSFYFAIQHLNVSGYTNEQRSRSIEKRSMDKDIHLTLVDCIRNSNKKMKRGEMLTEVNNVLKVSGKKEISLSSLKRYISASKVLSNDERTKLYEQIYNRYEENKSQLDDAIKNKNEKQINLYKKKCKNIDINIIKYLNGGSV